MVRLLHVISDMNIGGAGRALLLLLRHLDRTKYDVTVAVPRHSALVKRLQETGVRYTETDFGRDRSHESGGIAGYKKLIREINPQIVHTHASLDAKTAAWQCRVPVRVYTRHSVFDPPRSLTTFPGKLVSGTLNNTLATHIIAVAEAAKENLVATGVSPKKITVILNGVEPLVRTSDEERADLRRRLGLRGSDFVCSLAARFEPYKGHSYLLETAEIVKKTRSDVKFLLLGAGTCYAETLRAAEEKDLRDTVLFAGFQTDVVPYVNITDCALNCSWGTEATSLSLLESMSLGIPAAVTDFGGNPGVIRDGVNGLVVPMKDPLAMANAILRLADSDPLRRKLSEGASAIYAESFTAEVMTRKTEEVYDRGLKEAHII